MTDLPDPRQPGDFDTEEIAAMDKFAAEQEADGFIEGGPYGPISDEPDMPPRANLRPSALRMARNDPDWLLCEQENDRLRARLAQAEADLTEERALHGETARDLDESEAALVSARRDAALVAAQALMGIVAEIDDIETAELVTRRAIQFEDEARAALVVADTPEHPSKLDDQLRERRSDTEFTERLRNRVEADRPLLNRIADARPCPSTARAVLAAVDPNGAWLRCNLLAGHSGDHDFHMTWRDTVGAADTPEQEQR